MDKLTDLESLPLLEDRNIVFMPSIFNETIDLLLDAHEYFYLFGAEDQASVAENEKTIYTCEMSRITLRLSSIMAWLMVRRAVFAGKIGEAEATQHYSLDGQEICLHENRQFHHQLPGYMCTLLERSRELYERIWRLDNMLRESTLLH